MATAIGQRRTHVIIFSRKCLFLDDPIAQGVLNLEVATLASYPYIESYFTSRLWPTPPMIAAIPDA